MGSRTLDDGFVLGGQAVEGCLVDVEVELGAAFPPARVVVVLCNFLEAELFVIVRTDPFGGVDGAFFQCLVDLATGDVLRHATHAGQHLASETADAHLHALDVGRALDFLAVPATHLGAGVAAGEVHDVVLVVELAEQLQAVAVVVPGGQLAAVQAEGDGRAHGKRIVLAEVVIGCGVGGFNSALLHAIHHAESGHQFATGVHRNGELAARHFAHLLGEHVSCAVDGVQRFGKAGSQTPADGGLGMHSGRGACGQHPGNAGMLDDGTTIHSYNSI
ncbi:hypothetical protein FQZ97_903330 [compost metagenome]